MIKFFIRRILSAQQTTAGLHIRGAHIIDCVVFDMCSQRYLKKKPSSLICRDIHNIIRHYLDLIEKNKHYLQKGPKILRIFGALRLCASVGKQHAIP